MARRVQVKAALVSGLVGAAAAGGLPLTWGTLALLVFGAANVIVAPPGTAWVRAAAFLGTFAALLWPHELFTPAVLLAWVVWPPAFMVAWSTARGLDVPDDPDGREPLLTRPRLAVAATIGAVAVASILYQQLVQHRLDQTAALFVGVPAVFAILVVFAGPPRSAAGVACKAVTIGLLTSLIFLWEGILCVLMSAPLFYAVAIFVAGFLQEARVDHDNPQSWFSCLMVLAVVPMSLEGVTPRMSLNRAESVTVAKTIAATPPDVERALFETPRFDRVMPLYLRAGFPRPVSTHIERSSGPARWIVRLRGGEMKLNGMEPRAGDLVLELVEARPGFLRWRAVSDDSHMTHFLAWQESTVEWRPDGNGSTQVTWTLRYRRGLDPAWYFGPWERYAAGLAASYLIDAVATP